MKGGICRWQGRIGRAEEAVTRQPTFGRLADQVPRNVALSELRYADGQQLE